MALQTWNARPPEAAALFNPAFCGLLQYAAVDGYQSHRPPGIPFELTFLVLPLLLHEPTRNLLPNSVRSPLNSWITESPVIRIGLGERVRESADLTRESLMFMTKAVALRIDERGNVIPGTNKPRMSAARTTSNEDVRERVQQAGLIGRLLSRAGTPAAILANFGLSP